MPGMALFPKPLQSGDSKSPDQDLERPLVKEKRRKNRRMSVLEELRAEEGCGVLFLSPSKIRRRDVERSRAQVMEDLEAARVIKAQEKALKRALKAIDL